MITYKIEDNVVYLIEETETHTVEKYFCGLIETRKTRIDNQYKIETLVFNAETEVQEVTETTYEPVPKEILLDELRAEYLPQIKDADLLGDAVEKARLQAEYLQKKTEIENT